MTDFFLDYRRTALAPTEVIVSVRVPALRPREYVQAFKQSRRREDDLALTNASMRVLLSDASPPLVEDIFIAYGGVSRMIVKAPHVHDALLGHPWNAASLEAALAALPSDVAMDVSAPGGMVEYRQTLAATFLFKFFLAAQHNVCGVELPAREHSAIVDPPRPVSSATHVFEEPLVGRPTDTIGQPIPHLSANVQVASPAPAPSLLPPSLTPHPRLDR